MNKQNPHTQDGATKSAETSLLNKFMHTLPFVKKQETPTHSVSGRESIAIPSLEESYTPLDGQLIALEDTHEPLILEDESPSVETSFIQTEMGNEVLPLEETEPVVQEQYKTVVTETLSDKMINPVYWKYAVIEDVETRIARCHNGATTLSAQLIKWLDVTTFVDSYYCGRRPATLLSFTEKGMALGINTSKISYYINPDYLTGKVLALDFNLKRLLYYYTRRLVENRSGNLYIQAGLVFSFGQEGHSKFEFNDYNTCKLDGSSPKNTIFPLPENAPSVTLSVSILKSKAKASLYFDYINLLPNGTLSFSKLPLEQSEISLRTNIASIYKTVKGLDPKTKATVYFVPEEVKSIVITGEVTKTPVRVHIRPNEIQAL